LPPTRNVRWCGASPTATCDGVKKNATLLFRALSTRAPALPRLARPPTMIRSRLWRGFIAVASVGSGLSIVMRAQPLQRLPTLAPQQQRLDQQAQHAGAEAAPHVQGVAAHREEFGCAIPMHSWSNR